MSVKAQETALLSRTIEATAFVATVAAIIAPRSLALLVPAAALAALTAIIYKRKPFFIAFRICPVATAFGVLMAYAALSVTWSLDPWHGIAHVMEACAFCLSAYVLSMWIGQQSRSCVHRIASAVVLAFTFGLLWLLFEVMSHQALKSWFFETLPLLRPAAASKHYRLDEAGRALLDPSDLDRNVAALNLLLWPILYFVTILHVGRTRVALACALFIAVALATFGAQHATSKIALAATCALFAISRLAPKISVRGLASAWLVATLAVCPMTWMAYDTLHLQNADWIHPTGRERISIWADISKRTIDQPFIGAGARMTNFLNERGTRSLTAPPSFEPDRLWLIGRHPHNVYLQVWFELGAVGAVLFAIAGLMALRLLSQSTVLALPYAQAGAAAVMIELGLCWDIWQRWFVAVLALTTVAFALLLRSGELRASQATLAGTKNS